MLIIFLGRSSRIKSNAWLQEKLYPLIQKMIKCAINLRTSLHYNAFQISADLKSYAYIDNFNNGSLKLLQHLPYNALNVYSQTYTYIHVGILNYLKYYFV